VLGKLELSLLLSPRDFIPNCSLPGAALVRGVCGRNLIAALQYCRTMSIIVIRNKVKVHCTV